MFEVLMYNQSSIQNSDVLERNNIKPNHYFLASLHREENIDNVKIFKDLIDTLNTIAETYRLPVLISTHPRTRNNWLAEFIFA